MQKVNLVQKEESQETIDNEVKVPRDIGGWLILVALGIVFAPLRILYFLSTTYPPIFTDGTWEALTTETSEAYSPIWGPYLLSEIVVNLALVGASFYLVFLFFTKKSNFPKWYAGLAVFSAIFILLDAYMVTLVVPDMPMFDAETAKEFGRSLVSCLVWTPYLFLSQRSKETFVR